MITIDVFTPEWVGTRFPVNSYQAATSESALKIIADALRAKSGIAAIEVSIAQETS
jgi:hypothetical protein